MSSVREAQMKRREFITAIGVAAAPAQTLDVMVDQATISPDSA
jgi:hypothetical protein